ELFVCLEAVLRQCGASKAGESRSVAAAMTEEWALRSDGLAAGAGALQRMLHSVESRYASLSSSEAVHSHGSKRKLEDSENEAEAVFDAEAKEQTLQ
ncbi:unnamed protein product, partial [Polarella glacialis]